MLLLCIHTILYAQQTRTVKGRVQTLEPGSNKRQPLPSASVVVLQKNDSTFIKGITSDKNGRFTLSYQPQKKKQYLLKVSFMGMQSVYRALEDSVSVNIGTVVLKDDDIQISEVTITGKLQEVVMEGDTTVINAAAFKTRDGAYLEDLVKRVPGLVYNKKDQSLTYNGQPISEINVNGESFFSGDKKTALENLPADLISKLKVYDKKSKEEEFTGISSGEKKYVLDLQTKDELNKTWLTNATVGYGNNQKKDLEGQIRLDQMYRERRFTRKSCAATLDDCPHIPGMCVEECCQTCDIPCGSRCGYSVKQPKVKVEEKWVINPDFEGSNSE